MRLQIIWFSFMLQLLSISVKSLFQGDTLLESDQMIQEEIQNEVNNYLRRVKHNLGLLDDNEEQNNDRNKRETSENFEMLDAGAGYRFKGFKEFYKIPGLFTDDIVLFCLPEGVSKEGCFGITLEGSDKNLFSDRLVLYKFDRYEFSKVDEVNIRNGIKLSTLFINNYQYVVVAECYNNKNYDNFTINHPHNNSAIYKVNHLSLKLEHIQTFSDKCLSDVVMWEQKDMNTVFLAAATNMIGNFQLNTESYVYKWLDTYFDKIDSVIKTYNPKSITPFTIGSTMYLAIANYQNDKGETDIDSEIYRYNLDKETFLLHQKIRTHAAMDIKYFFFEKGYQKESFLVVANHFVKEPDETLNYETHSIIYKFSDDKYFMPFQSIKVSAPIQWLPVMRGTNKSLLFVVSRFYGVKAYQYNGWRFVESPVRYFGRLFDSAITTIREFIFNNKSLLTIANKGNDGTEKNVFKIIIERDNQVPRFKSEMESWCKKTLEEVKDGNIVLSHILNSVHDVPHIDDKVIEINSDFVLTGDSRIGNITIIVNNDDDRVNKSVIDENDKTLTQFINNAENELKDLMNSFDKAPVYSIQKSENFSAIEIDCYPNSCQFDELFIESLNGENLTLLLKNTVDVKEDFTLNSKNNVPLEFENVAIQSVINTTYINNHKLNDLVTKYDNNLNQTLMVRGSIIIDNEDGITVSGTVDEVSISNDSVLLTTGDQSFSGKRLIAESLNIGNLTIEKTINHVPLNSNKAVNKRDNLLKVIPKLEVENLTLTDGLISGINLLDVVNNTLKVKSDKQIITGYYTYENLEVDELFVNNIIQNTSVIISPKRMSDYSRTETFILKPSNNNNNNYYIDQDEMYSYRRASSNDYHPKPNRAPYTNFYGDIIIEGRLIIRGGILNVSDIKLLHENISVSDIITNGLKLNDVINRPFKFTTPFQTKTLKVNDINGIKPESLLQRNEDIPVPITGHKTFIGDIYLNGGAIVNGTINGIDITDFEKNVNDSSLVKEFDTMAQKSSSMNYDSENNQINKKNIDQNSQYEIQDIWETVIIKNDIDVKSLWINKTVNGIDINDIIQYIKNNGSKKFEKSKVFNGNAQINKFVDDIEGFNDKNLESTVYCDSVEIDSKNLRYIEDKHLSVRSLVFSGSLDGVPANEFGKWLLSEGDQVIMGQQRVSSIETLKGLNIISGVINGVNITELSEISVKINEPSNLSGITFDCLVKSNENVEVSGLTNGIDIPNDVVLKYRPSTISSPVVITGDKVLMNDLVVDNIYIKSLDNLCRLFSNTTSNQSLVISGNVTFSKEPYVNTLNNITLQLLSGLAWLYYEDKIFTSTVSFPDVVFHHDIDLQGSFNGINLELLNKEYLSLTKDQKINAPITFMNGVIVKGLLRAKKVNVGRHVNGVVLDKFVDNILKNGTEQHISDILDFSSITVQDNFKTKGFINGLNITSDVLIISDDYNNDKYSRNIVVNGRTTIKNVITNNVFTDPNKVIKIQGVDIKKWDDLAVRKTGKYNVHGNVIINGGFFISDDIKVEGLVNGVKFDKDNILLTNSDQILTGYNVFDNTSDVFINKLFTDNYINNINFTDLLKKQMYKNENITVTGDKVFLSDLSANNVMLPEFYGELNLSNLNDGILNYEKYKAFNFHDEFEILKNIRKNVEISILGQAYLLKGWQVVQQIKGNVHLLVPLKSYDINPKFTIGLIAYGNRGYYLTVHTWNEILQHFVVKPVYRYSVTISPHLVAPIATYETDSGVKLSKLFIVTDERNYSNSDEQSYRNNVPQYKGWLFNWDLSMNNAPWPNSSVPMYHPGLLLHVFDKCYLLLDTGKGKHCHLYCNSHLQQTLSCENVLQGIVTSDGNNSYVVIARGSHKLRNRSNAHGNKKPSLGVWRLNDHNELISVLNITDINIKPYSISAVYDSDTKQHLLAVSAGTNLIFYRFNKLWNIIDISYSNIYSETSIKMVIVQTNEIVIFLSSPCSYPYTMIWVGGLSKPKTIPINLNGSEIKQVIPFRIETDDKVFKYYYIIVTDKETVVFKPIFTSIN